MWDKRAEYLDNHDGDTVKMVLDQGFGDTKLIDVRLLGVYAPELSEEGGKECQAFVEEWFETHKLDGTRWEFIVTTVRMKRSDKEQTTLSRYVGVITDLTSTSNLNAEVSQFIQDKGYAGGLGVKKP